VIIVISFYGILYIDSFLGGEITAFLSVGYQAFIGRVFDEFFDSLLLLFLILDYKVVLIKLGICSFLFTEDSLPI
jgi:hypothetical protein